MSPCCCIVPPQLLEGIANSSHNSEAIRAEARAALESHKRMMTARREHTAALHHPGTSGPRHGGIIPRDLLQHVAESEAVDETTRARARRDLESLAEFSNLDQEVLSSTKDAPYRYVYDCHHSKMLPGSIVRTEGQPPVKDATVNEAYDNAGEVLKFYRDIFNWNSIDNRNMDIIQSVHCGDHMQNACKLTKPRPYS